MSNLNAIGLIFAILRGVSISIKERWMFLLILRISYFTNCVFILREAGRA